jgi:hypothetical protein
MAADQGGLEEGDRAHRNIALGCYPTHEALVMTPRQPEGACTEARSDVSGETPAKAHPADTPRRGHP